MPYGDPIRIAFGFEAFVFSTLGKNLTLQVLFVSHVVVVQSGETPANPATMFFLPTLSLLEIQPGHAPAQAENGAVT